MRTLNLDGQPSRVVKYKYMKARAYASATSTVKLGVSRQVVIPKTIHDQLGLRPGDYLQVDVADGRVVFTPKTLVDTRVDRRIAERAEDVAAGRSDGPFESAEAMVTSLRAHVRTRRGSRKVRR
jgi:AbrB family looped-hinge helix DNA binding protein